jgi:hypothetical protein
MIAFRQDCAAMNTSKTRNLSRLLFVAATAGTIALGAASSVSASSTPPDASTPPGEGPPPLPEATDYCSAYLNVEAATNDDDDSNDQAAIETATSFADDEQKALIETVVGFVMAGDFESPEFVAAYDALVANAIESCGWATLDVTLSEYTFGGLPEEVPAGITVVNALNTGEQVHEILVLRVNDDVTLTAEEIAALPEEEAAQYASFVGIGFAFPGAVGHAFLDLTPGRYIALCYLPVGATPEIIAQLPDGPPDPATLASAPPEVVAVMEASPHFMEGMIQEFTVS